MGVFDWRNNFGVATAFLDNVAAGNNQVVVAAPLATQHIVIDTLIMSCSGAAGTIHFKGSNSTVRFPLITVNVGIPFMMADTLITFAPGESVTVDIASATNTSIYIVYHIAG